MIDMNENIVELFLKLADVAEEKRIKTKNVRIKIKKEYLSELESAGLIVNHVERQKPNTSL